MLAIFQCIFGTQEPFSYWFRAKKKNVKIGKAFWIQISVLQWIQKPFLQKVYEIKFQGVTTDITSNDFLRKKHMRHKWRPTLILTKLPWIKKNFLLGGKLHQNLNFTKLNMSRFSLLCNCPQNDVRNQHFQGSAKHFC